VQRSLCNNLRTHGEAHRSATCHKQQERYTRVQLVYKTHAATAVTQAWSAQRMHQQTSVHLSHLNTQTCHKHSCHNKPCTLMHVYTPMHCVSTSCSTTLLPDLPIHNTETKTTAKKCASLLHTVKPADKPLVALLNSP
jgi:hypothetical protein